MGVTVSKSLEDVKEQRPSTADSVRLLFFLVYIWGCDGVGEGGGNDKETVLFAENLHGSKTMMVRRLRFPRVQFEVP